jgi:hypothetical protein
MVDEKQARTFLKDHRGPAIGVLAVLTAGMLAAPVIIVALAPGGFANWLTWIERLTGLYAFTFIFMNIVSGALAPYFYAIFKAKGETLIHTITGGLGFLLALTHGLLIITQRTYRTYSAVWVIGPVALILLVLTIWVAFDRKRLKTVWRGIHIINYAIFIGVFVKAVMIGTDFTMTTADSKAVMILFSVYVGIAGIALLMRLRRYQVQAARKKAPAAKPPAPEPAD